MSVNLSTSCIVKSRLPQQMAQTAEVLPAERVLRLAQRIQDAPQSRHTDSADGGLHLQEILHRSGESPMDPRFRMQRFDVSAIFRRRRWRGKRPRFACRRESHPNLACLSLSRALARCWETASPRSSRSGCPSTFVKTNCSSYSTLTRGDVGAARLRGVTLRPVA